MNEITNPPQLIQKISDRLIAKQIRTEVKGHPDLPGKYQVTIKQDDLEFDFCISKDRCKEFEELDDEKKLNIVDGLSDYLYMRFVDKKFFTMIAGS